MDFSFLFDESRDLFAIGYNVGDQRLDNSFYDLLASEAASRASCDRPGPGRPGTLVRAGPTAHLDGRRADAAELERLDVRVPDAAAGHAHLRATRCSTRPTGPSVRRQIAYGKQRGVPWGISESGYNTIDAHMNYQYRAFGVPGLGLKRGLAEDLVIAPYASVLALMVAPEAACREPRTPGGRGPARRLWTVRSHRLHALARAAAERRSVTVRQFMAHHQGMSLLALAYVLLDKPMQRRFEADPMLRAADLLLQERVPKAVAPIFPHVAEASATRSASAEEEGAMRVFTDPSGPVPEVHLLSNGRYHVVVTSAGGGYSRWRDLAVTRWREDATRDCLGAFCYLRDLDSGALWSTAWQPTLKPAKRYQAIFTQARAEFRRSDDQIDTHTEISVSPEDDIELRRITITNRSEAAAHHRGDQLCRGGAGAPGPRSVAPRVQQPVRADGTRARSAGDPLHAPAAVGRGAAAVDDAPDDRPGHDRRRGVVRNRPDEIHRPRPNAGESRGHGRQGAALGQRRVRCSIRWSASATSSSCSRNETVRIDLVTGVAETRDAVMALMEKYSDPAWRTASSNWPGRTARSCCGN